MSKFVAIKSDGKVEVHATAAVGDYETLCGLDGNDHAVGQEKVPLPKAPRIDCKDCVAIIKHAKKY